MFPNMTLAILLTTKRYHHLDEQSKKHHVKAYLLCIFA